MRAPEITFTRARALRRNMSLPEVVLWQVLRRGQIAGLRFRRQHPVGRYILDFYCPYLRLAIEIDGSAHDRPGQVAHDERRQAWLKRQGISVLRIPAKDVLRDETLDGVLRGIEAAARSPTRAPGAPPTPPPGEEPQLNKSSKGLSYSSDLTISSHTFLPNHITR
jgi:very-short-patch-repair endonuclease